MFPKNSTIFSCQYPNISFKKIGLIIAYSISCIQRLLRLAADQRFIKVKGEYMQGSIIINESQAQADDSARHQELSEAFTRLGYQFCKRNKAQNSNVSGFASNGSRSKHRSRA